MALFRVPRFMANIKPLHSAIVRTSMFEPGYIDPHKGKVVDKSIQMPDSLGHAVGKERYELLCRLYGWDDPYCNKPVSRGAGTWEDPLLTYSVGGQFTRRHICACRNGNGEATYTTTMNLGIPKRCMCGYWFKLVPAPEPPFLKHFKWDDNTVVE